MFCFSNIEEALTDAEFVIEAIHENLADKKYIFESEYKIIFPWKTNQMVIFQNSPSIVVPKWYWPHQHYGYR